MEKIVTQGVLPDGLGEYFLLSKCSLRQKINGRNFASESYIETFKLSRAIDRKIYVNSRIFHSQKKKDSPLYRLISIHVQ